jgi:hypothetical protein
MTHEIRRHKSAALHTSATQWTLNKDGDGLLLLQTR